MHMLEHSTDVKELFAALHKAQGSLSGVAKDSVNPHFKNRYASLENVIDAAKGPLQANGLSFTQAPGEIVDGAIEITTMLMHVSGQWMRSTMHVPLTKKDPQGVGSAITYGLRYSLMARLGLPPVDDDAEHATERATAMDTNRGVSTPAAALPDSLMAILRKFNTAQSEKELVAAASGSAMQAAMGMLEEKHLIIARKAYAARMSEIKGPDREALFQREEEAFQ